MALLVDPLITTNAEKAKSKKKGEKGFTSLFDGKSLKGWKVNKENPESITVKDGNIVIDDGANIGIDSDTNLLDLNDQNLIVNGVLDSTGRIDAQSGLQVSGSTLAVGNDLTLNYTSPVSHSLMFVNHTNKTVDLVPAASASGQLVQYNGSGWVITDEIDGGSF